LSEAWSVAWNPICLRSSATLSGKKYELDLSIWDKVTFDLGIREVE
jgi:hypothetical protein